MGLRHSTREVIAAPSPGLDLRRHYGHFQAPVIFGNLELLLEAAGSSLDRLVQVHALIYDSIEYDVLNRVYRQYVANGPPARTVWAARIEAGFKVQLDVIAAA